MNSVYSAINPILMVSRLAAVCTIVKNKTKKELVVSRYLMLFQSLVTVVSILHLGFIPYAVIYLERMPTENYNASVSAFIPAADVLKSQGFITKMTNIILISTAAITVRISNLCQMHKIMPGLLKSIDDIDQVIIRRNNDWLLILIFAVILILSSWPYQIYSILMVTTNTWMALLMFYLNLYNNFSIITCEIQFVSLCLILKSRCQNILDELKDLQMEIYFDLDESILGKISRIRESHKVLTECFAQLNSLYGIPLFAALGSLSLNILFTLYFAIFGGFKRDSENTDTNQVSGSADYVIWSFYYFGRFLIVCTAAGRLTAKANFIKSIVCNLFHKSLAKEIKQEIWIYFAYLMSNEIQINACGFFNVGIPLITSAISTSATYLVILAQFQSKR